MSQQMTVDEWVKLFPGVEEAAKALGVTRMTLWRWNEGDCLIPDHYVYKALALSKKMRKRK